MTLPRGYLIMIVLGTLAGWLPRLRGGSWYTPPNATWRARAWQVYWATAYNRHKNCKRED